MDNFTPTRSSNGMFEFKHNTGLTVILVPKNGLEVTTANITYRVGSRNEGLGVRGSTHYLEHGMFKGSSKYHGKNGMWKLEELGAYMNATTYTDRTNYFSVIDSNKLEYVIDREADRMKQPLLCQDELKKEMTVVRNEFERGENNDFEVLQKRVMATAFMAHPYHHSTIGWKSEIENVTAESLRKFHDTFYKPSNATYTFVGNFDTNTVLEQVNKSFGERYDGEVESIPDMYTTEPAQMGQRRVTMQRPTNCALLCVAFKAPNGLHRDSLVLKVIANIISTGPQSLSEQFKRDTSLPVHDIIAEWERMRDPYLFSIWGTTNHSTEKALQKTEDCIHTITCMFKNTNMDSHLKRAKQYIRNAWDNEMLGTRKTAMAINEAIARGDAFDVFNRHEVLSSITVQDVRRVATDIFNLKRSTVGWLYPGQVTPMIEVSTYPELKTTNFNFSDIPEASASSLKLSNNEFSGYNNIKTDVRISIQVGKSDVASHVNKILLSQLMSKGFKLNSTNCEEKQLYEYLAEKNIQRDISAGMNTIHIQASIPSNEKTIKSAASLLMREIKNPILNEQTFTYLKGKWASELAGGRSNVNTVAKIRFNQVLFQKDDVNYKYDINTLESQINNTSYRDIIDYHKHMLNSPRLVTILGNTDIDSLRNDKTWERTFAVKKMGVGIKDDYVIDGKASAVLKYGMIVSPENLNALKLAVGVLGNGFSGRLMKIVRDQHGLTYGINARLKRMKGCQVFEITGTFSPNLLEEGIKITEEVIKGWLSDTLTEEEINVQKNESIGSKNVQYDTPGALASAIHIAKINTNTTEYIDSKNYHRLISGVSVEQVNEEKRKISFESLSRVKVGSFTV